MDSPKPTRLDHDSAATSFPKIPVVSRGAETGRARVEAARLVFTFAEAEYERGRQAGARDALLQVLDALDRGQVPEVLGTLRVLTYHGPDYVPAVLRSLDALAGERP